MWLTSMGTMDLYVKGLILKLVLQNVLTIPTAEQPPQQILSQIVKVIRKLMERNHSEERLMLIHLVAYVKMAMKGKKQQVLQLQ